MSEPRTPAGKGTMKEYPQGEPTLDHEHAIEELNRFLGVALREMNLAVEYSVSADGAGASPAGGDLVIAFHGQDEGLLLERNAELLLALEHIAHRWLRLEPRMHDRVRFDCAGYRTARLQELKLSARVAAQRVRETGQAFRFNPMSSRERRIVHLELTGAPGVRTISEGAGDRRHLVIYPSRETR
jgi:spoIIIJ-associated protein